MSKKCIKNPYSIACLLICFLAQDMAWGASELFKAPSRVVATTVNQILANPTNIQVPYEHATLKEIHQSTSKLNQKLIILIEDAHSNYSGQMSLAGSLDEMMRTYGLSLILAEGSSKDVTLDEVKDLADAKTWQIAAKRFLMEGVISGEEYLNLTSDLPMSIRGMEYQDLYEKNLKTYSNLVKRRRDILLYLHKINISISKVKTKLYPKILLDYELAKAKSDSEGGGFTPYLDDFFALQEEAQIKLIQDYPEVSQLKQLRLKEKAIDFELANREQGALYRSISQKGAKDEINHIIEASKRSKNLQISQYSLLTRVFTLAKEYGMDSTNHKELNKYYDYLKAFTDLKLNPLLEQIERLEDEFYKVLLTEEDTRRVRIIDRYVGLLDKAYRIQMSSTDFQAFIANRPDFNTQSWEAFLNLKLEELDYLEDLIPYLSSIDDAEGDLRDFYETVNDRDEAFVENTERIMQEEGQQAAFMIAGGYHTHNLTRLLREKDYSYVVLTPVVTFETDHNKYEQLLLMPLENDTFTKNKEDIVTTDLSQQIDTTLKQLGIVLNPTRLSLLTGFTKGRITGLVDRLTSMDASRVNNKAASSRMSSKADAAAIEAIKNVLINNIDARQVVDKVALYRGYINALKENQLPTKHLSDSQNTSLEAESNRKALIIVLEAAISEAIAEYESGRTELRKSLLDQVNLQADEVQKQINISESILAELNISDPQELLTKIQPFNDLVHTLFESLDSQIESKSQTFIQNMQREVDKLQGSNVDTADFLLSAFGRLPGIFDSWGDASARNGTHADQIAQSTLNRKKPSNIYELIALVLKNSQIDLSDLNQPSLRFAIERGIIIPIQAENSLEQQRQVDFAKQEITQAEKEFGLDTTLNYKKPGLVTRTLRALRPRKPISRYDAGLKTIHLDSLMRDLAPLGEVTLIESLKTIKAWYTNVQFEDSFSPKEKDALKNLSDADKRDVKSLNRYFNKPNDDIYALAQLTLDADDELFRGPRLQLLIDHAQAGQNQLLRDVQRLKEEAWDVLKRLEKAKPLGLDQERETFIGVRKQELIYLEKYIIPETQIDFDSLRGLSVEEVEKAIDLKIESSRSKDSILEAWNLLLFGRPGRQDGISGYQLISKKIRAQYLIPGSIIQFENGEYRRIGSVEAMTYEYQKIDSQGNTLDEIRVDGEGDAIKLTDRIMDGRVKNISGEVTNMANSLRRELDLNRNEEYFGVDLGESSNYEKIRLRPASAIEASFNYTQIKRDLSTGQISIEASPNAKIDMTLNSKQLIILQLALTQLNLEEAARMSAVVRGGLELQEGNFGSDLELRVNGKAATLKWSEDGNSIILNSDSQTEVKIKLNEKDPTPIMWEGAEIHVQPNDDGVSVQIINQSQSRTYIASVDRSKAVALTESGSEITLFEVKKTTKVEQARPDDRGGEYRIPAQTKVETIELAGGEAILDIRILDNDDSELRKVEIKNRKSPYESVIVSFGQLAKGIGIGRDTDENKNTLVLKGSTTPSRISREHLVLSIDSYGTVYVRRLSSNGVVHDKKSTAKKVDVPLYDIVLSDAEGELIEAVEDSNIDPFRQAQILLYASKFAEVLRFERNKLRLDEDVEPNQLRRSDSFFRDINLLLEEWDKSSAASAVIDLESSDESVFEQHLAINKIGPMVLKVYRELSEQNPIANQSFENLLSNSSIRESISDAIRNEVLSERGLVLEYWQNEATELLATVSGANIVMTDGEKASFQNRLGTITGQVRASETPEKEAVERLKRPDAFFPQDRGVSIEGIRDTLRRVKDKFTNIVSPNRLTRLELQELTSYTKAILRDRINVFPQGNLSVAAKAFVYISSLDAATRFSSQRFALIGRLANQGRAEAIEYLELRKSKAFNALARLDERIELDIPDDDAASELLEKSNTEYREIKNIMLDNLSFVNFVTFNNIYAQILIKASAYTKPNDIIQDNKFGNVYAVPNDLEKLNEYEDGDYDLLNDDIEDLVYFLTRNLVDQASDIKSGGYFELQFPYDDDYEQMHLIASPGQDGRPKFKMAIYIDPKTYVVKRSKDDVEPTTKLEKRQNAIFDEAIKQINLQTGPKSLQNQLAQIIPSARMGQRNVIVGYTGPKTVKIGGKEIRISLLADKQFIKFQFQDKAYAKYNSSWSINEPFSPITIGRSKQNKWTVAGEGTIEVSREHATISIEPEGLMLTNHSQNGTLVDGDYLGGDKEDGSSFEDKTIIIEFRQVSEDNDVVVDAYVTSLLDLIRIAGGVYRRAEKSNERRKDKPSHASVETARDEYGIVRDEYGPNKTLAKDLFLIQRLKKGLDNALGSQLEQIKRLPAGSRSEFKQLITDAKTAQRKLFRSQAYLNRITTEKEFTSDEGLIIDALYAEIKLKSDISVFRQRDLSDVKLTQALKAFAIVGSLESIENEFPGQRADLIRQYAKQGQRHALAHLKQSRSKTELALERWSTRLDEMENQDTFLERPLYESRKRDFDNSESSYDEYFSIKRNGKAVRELTYNDAIRANEFYRNVSNEADNRIRSGDIISAEDDPNESSDQWSNAKRRPTAPRMAGLDAVKSFEALSDLLGKLRGRIAGLTEADIMTEAGRLGPIDGELKVSFAKLHKLNFVSELDDSARNLEERQKSLSDTTPFESRAIVRQSSPLNGLYLGIEDLIVSATEAEEMRDLIIIRDRAINQSVGSQGEDSQVTALMRLAAERVVLFWRKGEGDLSLEDTFREYSQILDLERRTGLMLIDSNSLTVPNTEDLGALNTRFQKLANEHQLRLLNHLKAYAENEQLEGELKDYFNARGLYQEAISAITTFVRNSFDLRSTININSRDQALELLNEFDAELKTFESFDGEQIIEYEGKDETPDLFDVMRQVLIAAVRNIDERLSNAEQIDEGSTDYASVYGSLPRFSARMTPIFNASTEEGMDELLRFVSIYGVDGFDPEATNVTPEDIERMQMKEAVLIDGPKGKAINIILEGEVFTLELNNHSATLGSTTNAVTFNISRSELIRQKSLSDADIKTSGQSIILPSSASVLDTIQSVDAVRDRVQIFNQFVRRLRRKTAQMDQKIHFHLHLDEGIGDTEAYQSVLSKLTFNDPNLEVTLSSFTGAPVSIGDEAIGDEVIIKEIVFTGPKGLVNIPGKKFTVLNVGASGDGLANIGDVALRGFQLSAIKLSDGDTLSAGDTQRALENLARGQASFENKPTMQAVQYMYKFPGTDKAVEVLIQFPAKRNLTIEDLLRIGTMMEKSVNWAA